MTPFRLSRVLRLRSRLRHLRQLEAARLEVEEHRTAARCADLQAERDGVLARAAQDADGGVEGAVLGWLRDYERVLHERESTAKAELVLLKSQLEQKRGEIADERREERKLEHLAREHRARQDAAAANAAERLIDELALASHVRGIAEGNRGR